MPAGRPTKYKEEYCKIAQKACDLGATDADLAEMFEVNEDTINEWKKKHPKFSESLKNGKDKSDDEVERSLYERARGYSHEAVHFTNHNGEVTETPYIKHYPPDPTSMIFWLKNRRRKHWRDKIEHGLDDDTKETIKSITRTIVDPKK